MKKDLISMSDLTFDEAVKLLGNTFVLKEKQKKKSKYQPLVGRSLGMIFQKPSTRTATSFAVGMYQLGGLPIMFSARDLQLQRGESISDTAKVLDRYLDMLMIRANRHSEVLNLAQNASIPVINGLTDKEHPCQVLADIFTLVEKKNLKNKLTKDVFNSLKVCYVGDSNNVANSWILASAITGINLNVSSPKGYEPEKNVMAEAKELSAAANARITVMADPVEAVKGCDVIYTDVWTSMGKEDEQESRKSVFKDYQVNEQLVDASGKKDVLIMHCLPAHRGEEITSSIVDGPNSVVFDQAENRLHIQKAVMLALSGIWEV